MQKYTCKRFAPSFFSCLALLGHFLLNQPIAVGQSNSLSAEQWSMVNLINKLRVQSGVSPLAVSSALQNASQWMANDMATNNYFGYRDTLRRAPGTRLQAFGYTSYWGEDITNGYSDAQNSLNQWLFECSPDPAGKCTYTSRAFLTDPGWVVMGIGRAFNPTSQDGWYWTLDMGQYKDATISQGPITAPVIASFVATPSTTNGGSTSLLWSVSGATNITIDNNIGDVSNTTFKTVSPSATTTYRLTATNTSGSVTATTTITVAPLFDTQPPSAPILSTPLAVSSAQVDLSWVGSTDNVAVASYQIIRNNNVMSNSPASMLAFSDKTVMPNTSYSYQIRAFDAAGNSAASAIGYITTPVPPVISNCPVGSGVFIGCYYAGISPNGTPTKMTTDLQIMFDWSNAFAGRPTPLNNFSARWQGKFNFAAGSYVFNTVTSDGMRVYIDDPTLTKPEWSSWKDQAPTLYAFPKALTAGEHTIVVEYYNNKSAWPISYLWWNKQ